MSNNNGNEQHDQEPPKQQDDPPRDEEGLLKSYNVIICGTGLVQSILASALSRAGKSVLHCDSQGHYGELNAVLALPYLQEGGWFETKEEEEPNLSPSSLPLYTAGACHSLRLLSSSLTTTITPPPLQVGTEVMTAYGKGNVTALPISQQQGDNWSSLAVSLQDWKLADGSHAMAYFGQEKESTLGQEKLVVIPTSFLETRRIFQQIRSFALDVSPRFIYASGRAVSGLLKSGVADYLEFKSMEGILWMSFDDEGGSYKLSRVPCSKGDVFGTKLLKPMDKRRLMKFLQLTMDYATTATSHVERQELNEQEQEEDEEEAVIVPEEEVQSLNERQLNQGRSLARPQNKAVSTQDLERLQQCIEEEMDFETYLSKEQKLSPHLQSLVRHALALETSTMSGSTLEGMTSLCQHVQALGRYGTTAFLVPLYGSGELPQAFCRSSAVHGGTYLLRRAPKRILLQQDGTAVKGIVLGGDRAEHGDSSLMCGPREDKSILCQHVVTSKDAMRNNKMDSSASPRHVVLRRISIVRGKLIKGVEQRHVILFPPRLVGNSCAIHGVALDDSVQVAPAGCTVLHLTTTVDADKEDVNESILERAVQSILSSQRQEGNDGLEEIYHVSFSYALCEPSTSDSNALPSGLHLCPNPRQNLVMDGAFEQAKQIFDNICPNVDFLSLSEEMDSAVKERIGDRTDENDDERMVLESAMNMMDITPTGNDENETAVSNE